MAPADCPHGTPAVYVCYACREDALRAEIARLRETGNHLREVAEDRNARTDRSLENAVAAWDAVSPAEEEEASK